MSEHLAQIISSSLLDLGVAIHGASVTLLTSLKIVNPEAISLSA